jgi:hypothetical protein
MRLVSNAVTKLQISRTKLQEPNPKLQEPSSKFNQGLMFALMASEVNCISWEGCIPVADRSIGAIVRLCAALEKSGCSVVSWRAHAASG